MWKNIEAAPADSILGLTEAFRKDPSPQKVNLGVGVYKDDAGRTPILACVKAAEKILLEQESTKSYLPISGDPAYAAGVQKLLFGEGSEVLAARRAATVHAPGGTGALRVGADLLKKFMPEAKVWISGPTWANHKGVFTTAGFALAEYPYYDPATKGVDFAGMVKCLKAIPAGDIVLLHACCHNPSGVDLDNEQWRQVVAIAGECGWMPFLDFAYQGFGAGVEEDRYAVEQFAATGRDFFIASSFSKNFGLYNERAGALTIVSPTAEESAGGHEPSQDRGPGDLLQPAGPWRSGRRHHPRRSGAVQTVARGTGRHARTHRRHADRPGGRAPCPGCRRGFLLYQETAGHVLLQRAVRCDGGLAAGT